MKINEVVFGRKFNLGNFESMELRVSVSPDPELHDDKIWKEVLNAMYKIIDEEINKIAGKIRKK